MFRTGLIALLASILLQIPARMHPGFHPDAMDGLRGVCLGVFLGTMAVAAWRNNKPARS